MPAPRATPSAATGGCSRISSGHVGPEVDKDRNSDGDFDILIKNMWLEHLLTLPENVAARKRWKSGYWHKWYKDLDLSDVVDDLHNHANCEILVAENEEFENDDVDDNFNWIPEQEASEPDTDDPLWSVVGSPPFTEDARHELPALHDHDQQGGNSEAKPFLMGAPSWSEELPEQWYLPEVLQRAREKFECFYGFGGRLIYLEDDRHSVVSHCRRMGGFQSSQLRRRCSRASSDDYPGAITYGLLLVVRQSRSSGHAHW